MNDLPIILLGVGGVGRSLIQQVLDSRHLHADQYGVRLGILAVCDSSGAVIASHGDLDDTTLSELFALKESGNRLSSHSLGQSQENPVTIIEAFGRPNTIVVDCTASDDTLSALLAAKERGYKIVLANKKPLTTKQEVYDRLTIAGVTTSGTATNVARHLGCSRWETTVGAGLPAIAMLNRLVASGDEVNRITGTFSGTLGYVMTGLEEGRAFSDIVREAHQLGYTEPDPRDDLGGVDVARKALILARGLGWKLNMNDVEVEGLYPAYMDDLSVDAFMDALPQLDESFQTRVKDAAAAGKVLRYAATIENQQCQVKPTVVAADSPLGRLSGTDNLVEFNSRWYSPNPLVIQGRGAGVEATAAGILSDILELAYTS